MKHFIVILSLIVAAVAITDEQKNEGLTDDERTSIINECLALKGTDSTDTAFNIYRCYRQKTTKGHFDVLL
ncbi:hypothetical protein QE152_g37581 [Popillia japonica]|uniref:Uncharacterized protein n=1 Tax=Popillia japonica TaxID=7064 RepID=A0AAW1I988_POPJA